MPSQTSLMERPCEAAGSRERPRAVPKGLHPSQGPSSPQPRALAAAAQAGWPGSIEQVLSPPIARFAQQKSARASGLVLREKSPNPL